MNAAILGAAIGANPEGGSKPVKKSTQEHPRFLDARTLPGEVCSVGFDQHEHLLACTREGHVYRYRSQGARIAGEEFRKLGQRAHGAAVSPHDGSIAVCLEEGGLAFLNAALEDQGTASLSGRPCRGARFGRDGSLAAWDGAIWLHGPGDAEPRKLAFEHEIDALAWTPAGELILAGGTRLWRVRRTGKVLAENQLAGQTPIHRVEVSPDGRWVVVTQGKEGTFLFAAGSLVLRHELHEEVPCSACVFSRDGSFLLLGDESGHVAVLALLDNEVVARWPAHSGAIVDLACDPGGERLATCAHDGSVELWRLDETRASMPVLASDLDHGEDALDLDRDVAAFSRVILAPSLEPPLAIGMFGDWGTGKTFFLEKLEQRIARDAARAREQEEAGDTPACLSHPVQITFNAWHYAEGNLWASLIVHLFDELGRLVKEPEEDPREARARLMRNLESAREARKQAARRYLASKKQREKAREHKAHVRRKLERARTRHAQLCNSDILHLVTDVVMDRARRRARKAGSELTGELGRATEEWARAALSLRSTWGRIKALVAWMLSGPRRGFAVLLVLFLCLGWTLLMPVLSWSFSELRTWGSGVFLLLAGSGTGMLRAWKVVREPLDQALAYIESNRERLARANENRLAQGLSPFNMAVEDARSRLDRSESELARAEESLARASAEVEAAAHAAAEARQGRQLFRFLAERADSDDYRQHLGLISLIKRDLDRLATLVGVPDKDQKSLSEQKRVARIDRIVLYIDDLDRCAPERVIDVLQAVHLLLGMRLFVVLVAVDSRWLMRSLDEHYAGLLRKSDRSDDVRLSTPRNYLEKIFQIPYVLDQMDQGGYARLIDVLVGGKEPAARAGARPGAASLSGEGASLEGPGAPGKQASGPAKLMGEEQVPVEAVLGISRDERLFMHRLHPLIGTPRAVKSFVNVAKLMRARLERPRRGEPSLATYLAEGEYKVALLLLAIQVGHSAQAALLGEALTRGEYTESWEGLLKQLRISRNQNGAPSNQIAGNLDEAQAASWQAIVDIFTSLREAGEIPEDLAGYEPWVWRIRQFSFDPWRASSTAPPLLSTSAVIAALAGSL